MKVISKIYYDRSIWDGMTASQRMGLEVESLTRLKDERHFPLLLKQGELEIQMTDCGNSYDKMDYKPDVPDLEKQIDEIINALEKNNIEQIDCMAKNICFKDGVIYMIDFDLVVLDGKPLNGQVERRYNGYLIEGGVEFVRNRLINVCS